MTLSKIRLANKKWKRQKARKDRQLHLRRQKLEIKKTRKALLRQRREQLDRREGEKDYVKQLESEVLGEARPTAG